MMQVGANQSATYHSQPSLTTSGNQTGRSSSSSTNRKQQQQAQYDEEQLANIRPRLCLLRKWPHYDGYGVHLARNQHWLGLRIGDVEPNSPAESGGLLREDVVITVNGRSVENDDFFAILSFIQQELEDEQIRFLVLDPHSADLARRHHLKIDETYRTCVRMETPTLTVSPEKLLYDQWRATNIADPTIAQNTVNLGPTTSARQHQPTTSSQRQQEQPPHEGPDVYTFLPYSDHALENGKSFFDVLFQQETNSASRNPSMQQQSSSQDASNKDYTGDKNIHKKENPNSNIDNGIKNIVNQNVGNLKTNLQPVYYADDEEEDEVEDNNQPSISRAHDEPISKYAANNETQLLTNQPEDEFSEPESSTDTNSHKELPSPYEHLWQSSSVSEDTNNNLRPEPRMCSVTLRPGIDSIGISLHPDKDFGHIIKNVDVNSLADRAGIEPDDCIVSLNDIPLLNAPYDEVLKTLRKSRHESNLDFLVAKKSYLLKSRQQNSTLGNVKSDTGDRYSDVNSNIMGEVLPSSNISERDKSSTVGAAETLEQLYNKYSNDRQPVLNDSKYSNRPKETISTTTSNVKNDQPSLPLDDDQYSTKPQQQGQIFQGVGPATADRSSWGISSGKSTDLPSAVSGDSSVRSNTRGPRSDIENAKGRGNALEEAFKPLQVGITNQTQTQQTGNISPTSPSNLTSRPTSSIEHGDTSPKALPVSSTTPASIRGDISSSKTDHSIQSLPPTVPIISPGISFSTGANEQKIVPTNLAVEPDLRLAKLPLSELKNLGYEFHYIQLMQPTETSPVGLKLSRQLDPLQFIITAVAKGTKADLAGLKVDDWLVKIEDRDVRLLDFAVVSREIRELLTNDGLIDMVVARKKAPTPVSITTKNDKDSTVVAPSSQFDSLSRQQGGKTAASLLTTDITRDTPDNSQVRFIPDPSTSPISNHSERSPVSNRQTNVAVPGGPNSVGLTNPIPEENIPRSPHSESRSESRSPSRSPVREPLVSQQLEKKSLSDSPSDDYDEKFIRTIELKEPSGLDFNSFIPENENQIQIHFISNVQRLSAADNAGLRDGDRVLAVNDVDVTSAIHEDVRQMMKNKRPIYLTVVNDPKYLELIETLGHTSNNQKQSIRYGSPVKPLSSDSSNGVKPSVKSESPTEFDNDELSKFYRILFKDDNGTVKVKHCILRKEPSYNGYGLILRYQNGLHLIDQVEYGSPAYNSGLRENDIILCADKKNVEQSTHEEVKKLIRKLSEADKDIDLILMKRSDVPRYKVFEEKNSIDWKPILDDKLINEKTEQSKSTSASEINDQRKLSPTTNKQAVSAPIISSTNQSSTTSGTRVCTLKPSVDRTAGFALSGKTAPPYIICQVENGTPAEKAGLRVHDALLSINGRSVVESTYEETVKLVKEALQKPTVELVVREQVSPIEDKTNTQDRTKFSLGSHTSTASQSKETIGGEPSQEGASAVEEYQKQRNKELSYTLRLCHLHSTNADGTQAATFGFELSEEPEYEYPVILRVEQQSPAEGAGLQSRDVLLKINDRKTKGLGYDKIKKEIEKAKRDGRLEMLVADQETYDYCLRTKKTFKEPDIKIKHIFPKSRSLASFHKVPSGGAMSASTLMSSRESTEQLSNSNMKSNDSFSSSPVLPAVNFSTRRETESENNENKKKYGTEERTSTSSTLQTKTTRPPHAAVSFDLPSPASTATNASVRSHETPLKFLEPAQKTPQQRGASSNTDQTASNISQSTTALNRTQAKESKASKAKSIPNAINSLFHKIGHSKSSKRS